MYSSRLLIGSTRTIATATVHCARPPSVTSNLKPTAIRRPITSTTKFYKEDQRSPFANTNGDTSHEGQFSRTDNKVSIEYPEEADLPRSAPVQGRGSIHFKRTLASFSLEGRSGVITGGARGLGLIMSQALVISGADVAIVDLNSGFQGSCQEYKR